MVNAKHGVQLRASRAGCIPCKRADCGADVMRGGDRLKEHISALSGAERLSSLVNLFSPWQVCVDKKMRGSPETTESRREDRYQTEELRHRRATAFQLE